MATFPKGVYSITIDVFDGCAFSERGVREGGDSDLNASKYFCSYGKGIFSFTDSSICSGIVSDASCVVNCIKKTIISCIKYPVNVNNNNTLVKLLNTIILMSNISIIRIE